MAATTAAIGGTENAKLLRNAQASATAKPAAAPGARAARPEAPAEGKAAPPPKTKGFLEQLGDPTGHWLFGKSDKPFDGDASHFRFDPQDKTGREAVIYVNGAGANLAASVAGANDFSDQTGRNVQFGHVLSR